MIKGLKQLSHDVGAVLAEEEMAQGGLIMCK